MVLMRATGRRYFGFGAVVLLAMFGSASALADAAQTAFCAKVSSQTEAACVPVESGPEAAWSQAAAAWKAGSAEPPVIALWAVPGMSVEDLAVKKNAKADFFRQVSAAMAFAKTKDRASYAASLREQIAVQEKFKIRAEDILRGR